MNCTLAIVRYPKWLAWAGFLSMAIFRLPLWWQRDNHFWKLMGCGKNGTFSKTPDWRQWAVMVVYNPQVAQHFSLPKFLPAYWKLFKAEVGIIHMQAMEGHGTWDGKLAFGPLPKQSDYQGMIGVLTRAAIRTKKLHRFWQHVDAVAQSMVKADGFLLSVGIGEVPWIKQATFSIWQSKQQMKTFAYSMAEHKEVVQKTRKEDWYSEDMFVRFKIISCTGTVNGGFPLPTLP
jgi:hypothetical protein